MRSIQTRKSALAKQHAVLGFKLGDQNDRGKTYRAFRKTRASHVTSATRAEHEEDLGNWYMRPVTIRVHDALRGCTAADMTKMIMEWEVSYEGNPLLEVELLELLITLFFHCTDRRSDPVRRCQTASPRITLPPKGKGTQSTHDASDRNPDARSTG